MIIEIGQKFDEATGERQYPVVPAGIYDARITGVVDCVSGEKSKHPGSPMWKLKFTIEDGDPEVNGLSLSTWVRLPIGEGTEWMDDKTREGLINDLKRLWNATNAVVGTNGSLDSDDLLGCTCRIDVTLDNSDDKQPRNNVNDILPIV